MPLIVSTTILGTYLRNESRETTWYSWMFKWQSCGSCHFPKSKTCNKNPNRNCQGLQHVCLTSSSSLSFPHMLETHFSLFYVSAQNPILVLGSRKDLTLPHDIINPVPTFMIHIWHKICIIHKREQKSLTIEVETLLYVHI